MTRQIPSIPKSTQSVSASPAKTVSTSKRLLRPLAPARNLTEEVVERIAGEISTGRMPPGTKLPTEQAMMLAMQVSRTVVREAVAGLRARGLVITRQGAGAFVSSDADKKPYFISDEGLGSLNQVIEVLELRLAVEVEGVALASVRATAAQCTAVRAALDVFHAAIAEGRRGVNEDYAFHRTIAAATGNSQFIEFLDFLGRIIIPRQSIQTLDNSPEVQQSYLLRIAAEHEAIVTAIEARAPERARDAMRQHLLNSCERYRRLETGATAP